MEVTLLQNDWDYITRNIMASVPMADAIQLSPVLPSENDPRPTTGRLRVTLSEPVAEAIIDELTNIFCSQGLRPDQEPNQFGLYVEKLIDVFYDGIRANTELL